MKTSNAIDKVAAKILEQIEKGGLESRSMWLKLYSVATNASTGKQYQGMNALLLGCLGGGQWATYKQWEELGAQVRKGETGTPCVKWVRKERKDDTGEVTSSSMIPCGFTVFSAAQVEGYSAPTAEPLPEIERHAMADAFFSSIPAVVKKAAQERAYFHPTGDYIMLPLDNQFYSGTDYYSVFAHELIHWTGHASRLDRIKTAQKGSSDYALEEATAEIGAAMLLAHLGLSVTPRPDHAAYIDGYISAPGAFMRAATAAQKAVEHLIVLAEKTPAVVTEEPQQLALIA